MVFYINKKLQGPLKILKKLNGINIKKKGQVYHITLVARWAIRVLNLTV